MLGDLRASNVKVKKIWREYIPGRIWNKVLVWLPLVLCTALCSPCGGCIRFYLDMLPSLLWSSPHGAEVGLSTIFAGWGLNSEKTWLTDCFMFLIFLNVIVVASASLLLLRKGFSKCSVGQSLFPWRTSERLSWVQWRLRWGNNNWVFFKLLLVIL